MRRFLLSGLLLVGPTMAVCAETSFVDARTARFFDGLRERRLFSLAEGHCLRELASDELSRRERAELLIELSRTFVEHARYVEGSERDDLWQRSLTTLDDFVEDGPRDASWYGVATQRALLAAAIGESLRRRVDVSPFDGDLRRAAIERLDHAIPVLVRIDDTLRKAARESAADAGRDAASPVLLRQLRYNVRFRLVVARLDRAALSPRTSPDRADQLNEATSLAKSLAAGDPREESTRRCHVLLARAARLRGDFREAIRLLDHLVESAEENVSFSLSLAVRDAVEAERARAHLDDTRPDESAAGLRRYTTKRVSLPGELRFEMVRALVAMWRVAATRKDADLASSAMQRLEAYVRATEVEVGGYWGYRSRLMLDFARSSGRVGPEVAALLREADAKYRDGDLAAAIAGYTKAVTAAERRGRNDVTEEVALTRASLELRSNRFGDAASHFADIAASFPESERAPHADLLAAYALGRVYDTDRTAENRSAYVTALERHRERFRDGESFGEATWMLARLHDSRLQYTDALRAYLDIPLEHTRTFSAASAIVRTYEAILGRLRERERPTAAWEQSAREQIAARIAALPRAPLPLDLAQADFATGAARFHARVRPPEFEVAEKLLEHVAVSASVALAEPGLDADDRTTWRALRQRGLRWRIITLAGTDRIDAARRLVAQLADDSPEVVLDVLNGLTQLAADSGPRLERALGYLQLETANTLLPKRDQLSRSARRQLDLCLAQSYAATAQPDKALATYERLLTASPKDVQLLETVGELLVECGRPDCLERAQQAWQRLERLHEPGSPAWLEARLRVADTLRRRGRTDECRKLLGVTRVLYPNLGGDAIKRRFDDLAAELERR